LFQTQSTSGNKAIELHLSGTIEPFGYQNYELLLYVATTMEDSSFQYYIAKTGPSNSRARSVNLSTIQWFSLSSPLSAGDIFNDAHSGAGTQSTVDFNKPLTLSVVSRAEFDGGIAESDRITFPELQFDMTTYISPSPETDWVTGPAQTNLVNALGNSLQNVNDSFSIRPSFGSQSTPFTFNVYKNGIPLTDADTVITDYVQVVEAGTSAISLQLSRALFEATILDVNTDPIQNHLASWNTSSVDINPVNDAEVPRPANRSILFPHYDYGTQYNMPESFTFELNSIAVGDVVADDMYITLEIFDAESNVAASIVSDRLSLVGGDLVHQGTSPVSGRSMYQFTPSTFPFDFTTSNSHRLTVHYEKTYTATRPNTYVATNSIYSDFQVYPLPTVANVGLSSFVTQFTFDTLIIDTSTFDITDHDNSALFEVRITIPSAFSYVVSNSSFTAVSGTTTLLAELDTAMFSTYSAGAEFTLTLVVYDDHNSTVVTETVTACQISQTALIGNKTDQATMAASTPVYDKVNERYSVELTVDNLVNNVGSLVNNSNNKNFQVILPAGASWTAGYKTDLMSSYTSLTASGGIFTAVNADSGTGKLYLQVSNIPASVPAVSMLVQYFNEVLQITRDMTVPVWFRGRPHMTSTYGRVALNGFALDSVVMYEPSASGQSIVKQAKCAATTDAQGHITSVTLQGDNVGDWISPFTHFVFNSPIPSGHVLMLDTEGGSVVESNGIGVSELGKFSQETVLQFACLFIDVPDNVLHAPGTDAIIQITAQAQTTETGYIMYLRMVGSVVTDMIVPMRAVGPLQPAYTVTVGGTFNVVKMNIPSICNTVVTTSDSTRQWLQFHFDTTSDLLVLNQLNSVQFSLNPSINVQYTDMDEYTKLTMGTTQSQLIQAKSTGDPGYQFQVTVQ
jgi:hypothetical protein